MADMASSVSFTCQAEGCSTAAAVRQGSNVWCSAHALRELTQRGLLRPAAVSEGLQPADVEMLPQP